MFLRTARGRGFVLALALGAASPAVAAIDLVGATSATLLWQPASGPVSGYVVYQVCELDGRTQKSSVITNQVTLSAHACSAFSVQVAAYGAGGLQQTGPLSDPSELMRFLPAPPPPESAPPPGPDASGGDPASPLSALRDFDADGRSDVLLHHAGDGSLELWSLRGARLALWSALPALTPTARIVGGGDYDGDGSPDLLGLDHGQVFVWLMRGATLMGGGPLGEDLGEAGSVEGSGDYDGDGVSDVLVRRPAHASIDVWSLSGGAIAAIDTLAPDPGPGWRVLGSGDHDGDGISDILWYDAAGGRLVLWRLLGRGRFQALPLPAPLGNDWEGVGVADFDGNGAADVLWRKLETAEIAVSLFDAGNIRETRRLEIGLPSPSREIVGTGDFDGDGHADVLVRNIGAKWLRLWRMNGASVISRTRVAELGNHWSPAGVGDESPSTQRWRP